MTHVIRKKILRARILAPDPLMTRLLYLRPGTKNSNFMTPPHPDPIISALSICTTDDSGTVGMPISFMCSCVKFVIRRSSQFYNKRRTWQPSSRGMRTQRLMFYRRRSHPLYKSKAPLMARQTGKISDKLGLLP